MAFVKARLVCTFRLLMPSGNMSATCWRAGRNKPCLLLSSFQADIHHIEVVGRNILALVVEP